MPSGGQGACSLHSSLICTDRGHPRGLHPPRALGTPARLGSTLWTMKLRLKGVVGQGRGLGSVRTVV